MCAMDENLVLTQRTQQTNAIASRRAEATVTIAPAAAAAAAAYDSVQRFVQLLPGGNGVTYCIQADGGLVWYRNTGWQTGSSGWANGGAGVQLGSG